MVAYLKFIFFFQVSKDFFKLYFKLLFSVDATMFLRKIKFFFAHKKLKKPPSKVAQKNSNPLFFLTASTAQMAQTEEFMFQNVAYRPTVYRTGVAMRVKKGFGLILL